MKFNKWLDTLIEEKEIDLEEVFEIKKNNETHLFDYAFIVEAIKNTSEKEQQAIKNMLVKIDFVNGDIRHYFRHLANAFI